ncbi:FecR family protein [Sphingobium tyrosinilyticum]|uniref:FecR family protein n=1 Tax=Sphingobium tyrosinilyticum TaxID=2715436 RepID=A0ABV9F0T3_9SPHN
MSDARRPIEKIDDNAAHWAIRLEDDALSDVERAVLEGWLAEDVRHEGALLRAQATLAYLDRGRALGESAASPRDFSFPDEVDGSNRRRFLKLSAAGLATAAAGAGGFLALSRLGQEEITTQVGEVRRVPLADGSVAVVNTASRVAIALQPKQRDIRLEEGEAWFQVAHDKARPFIVEAGAVRVRAVGTAFAVRRRPGGADVLVTEGVVETWIEGQERSRRRLTAGAQTYVDTSGSLERTRENARQDVERSLAWRSGEIVLDGQTVDYAAAELNRYNRQRIVIADPAIGRERLVGYFRTSDSAKFATAVAEMTGARVTEKERVILISR